MNTDKPRELEQIHWLFYQFIDAINRGGVSHQTALEALECALEDLLSDVCGGEDGRYFDILRDRAKRTWRQQNAVSEA
jgi:hypothetical protein